MKTYAVAPKGTGLHAKCKKLTLEATQPHEEEMLKRLFDYVADGGRLIIQDHDGQTVFDQHRVLPNKKAGK